MLLESNDNVSLCSSADSPLSLACDGGYLDIVKMLLEKNADASQCAENGEYPLYLACSGGHIEFVKLLLEKKC